MLLLYEGWIFSESVGDTCATNNDCAATVEQCDATKCRCAANYLNAGSKTCKSAGENKSLCIHSSHISLKKAMYFLI